MADSKNNKSEYIYKYNCLRNMFIIDEICAAYYQILYTVIPKRTVIAFVIVSYMTWIIM